MEVVEHRHLQAEIANGYGIVLGLHEIEAHDPRFGGCRLKGCQKLRED